MKRIIFAFIFISLSISILAQSDSLQINPLTPSAIVRLSYIAPKLMIEFDPTISPSFTFQPKFYFNLADRQAKGKRTDFYSGRVRSDT